MIFDVEQALKEYFIAHMVDIAGNGNTSITVYKEKFPDNADKMGISVFAEVPAPNQVFQIFSCAVKIHTRAKSKAEAYTIMQNIDKLIDRRVQADLSDTYNLCYCLRNVGPNHFVDRNLHLYSALYEVDIRQRTDNA